jgi:uncharacterized protein (TIGR02145 family)
MNYRIKTKVFFSAIFVAWLFLILANGCKKETTAKTSTDHETGLMTDIEGNVYKTIKIGSQWWMAENLKTKRFRNGNYVTLAQSDLDWRDTTASYCIYPSNNNSAPGYLYNAYVVMDTGNIAPAGWHIPTDEEWKDLEKNIGMSQSEADKSGWRGTDEGEKLKIESPNGWTSYGAIWSTNESGFTALAGGCRLFNGTLGDPGLSSTGFWWSASVSPGNEVWYRYLDYKNADVFRSHCEKRYGYSIRCVRDN